MNAPTEAADLAHTVLDDSEDEHPTALYVLYVHEARTLANAVARVEALADQLDREASEYLGRPVHSQAGDRIRAALNGDDQ